MEGEGLVLMGRVSGAFGVKGEIKIFSYGRDPEVFERAGLMYVGNAPGSLKPLTLVSLRVHGGRLLVHAREVATREDAARLGGQGVYLDKAHLAPLDEGEYYWYQLKGARVVDRAGRELGLVKEIGDLGAHDLLLVRARDGKEALIPVIQDVVLEIRPDLGLITVDLPPGLLEAQGWPEEPEPGQAPETGPPEEAGP